MTAAQDTQYNDERVSIIIKPPELLCVARVV